ncbi:MAG: M20/M25/M40 family metallo-hydrolase [Ignavibacteriae bacterium]|nr:M20/M25/M40 family metallo-hydrolase [Ignavibacteriota bacterium]
MKILALLISTLLSYYNVYSQDTSGVSFISKTNLMKTDTYLASKELNGRLSGSKGYYKAAEFMAEEFSKLGLKPLGNKNYFQNFKFEYNEIIAPCKFNLIENGKLQKQYKLGKDFVCRGFTGSGHFTAPVVFCGYGFSENEFNVYENIDVKGKIVLMFKQVPGWKIDDKNWNASLRYREKIAFEKGALAILFVSKPNDANPQKPIGSTMDGEGSYIENFPMLQIDIDVANELLKNSPYTLKELQTEIDSLKQPKSFDLNIDAELEINAKYEKNRNTMNVVGMLEGEEDDYIIIGAHLDHVGGQADEIYFPGANDNASGSSAVLEIARAFVNNKIKPKRSIIFILFSNEESGLNGATYFTENPLVPLEKVTAMLNMDCIGFGDSIHIGNGKSAPELWKITKELDSLYIKQTVMNTWNGGGADATPFHQNGIPCLYFVTTNSYKHLHLPSDLPETLNQNLFEKITRLAYLTALNLANGDYKREVVIP